MSTRPSAPRAAHIVIVTCTFALTALSLAACKGRSEASAGGALADTAAPAATMVPAGDTATMVSAGTVASPETAKPAATKPATAKPAAAKPAVAELASAPPPPPPPKTYPPFDPKASGSAIGVVVYPKNGQPIEQQHFEENECFAWAKTNTGIDPYAPVGAATAPPPAQGGAAKGAAKGAVAGVAIGAIAGDAGKGAAIGATAGGVAGRRNQKANNQTAANDAQAQAAAAADQSKKKFADGFTTCLDGKGYSAK
jgi:hypothetical protein